MQNEEPREDVTETSANSPAEGERRAITGYYPQYRVAAALILRALREENLESIRVADPEAGRVDDVQIASRGRLDAFQVKWSRHGDPPVTFRELTKDDDSTPSLVAQLADGWKKLRGMNSGTHVVVHLISNRRPSVHDRLPGGTRHFAAFVQEVWNVAHRETGLGPWVPPSEWSTAWGALHAASRLSAPEFVEFVKDCELEFGYELPRASSPQTSDGEIFTGDLKQLTEVLFGTVFDPAQIIVLSRDALLARVGWRDRVDFRSRHEFPLDEVRYEPITATVTELHAALDTLAGGYLGLLGSPGSGKSSLLTHTVRSRSERVIRYYAYVPDAQDPLQSRGEATSFLHDLILALERSGFRVGESLSRFDRDQLLNRLQAQLRLLHKDWQATGRKTVIAVDGLDHVARELRPHHSLLRDLPLPAQIPPGVVIVLGSQTDQLEDLPSAIQGAIREPGRRLEMQPLGRDAVYRIVGRAGLPIGLDATQTERVYQVSSGHPLALALVLNELQGAADAAAAAEILARVEPYSGDIERQYHSHWRQIETDDELAHFMGLVARLRRVIDLQWIESWAGPVVVARFRRKFGHYFRKESANRWYFFHNSFRLFVIKRTRETAPGLVDEARDLQFHRELADRCRDAQAPWTWEELYHRVAAGQHDLVLARATPAFFRKQLFALRPLAAIAGDIRLALRAVAARRDVVALTRLNLANAEITHRGNHLDDFPLARLLLSVGEDAIAVDHIRDGNQLRVARGSALRLARWLRYRGLAAEARTTFELAEPLEMVATAAPVEDDYQSEKQELLEEWAEVAPSFRDLADVLKTVEHLAYRDRDGKDGTPAFRRSMLFHVGLGLMQQERWDELEEVFDKLDTDSAVDPTWWFWLNVRAWRHAAEADDGERARSFVARVQERGASGLSPSERVVLAEAVFRILGNETGAKALIVGVEQPELVTDFLGARSTIAPFFPRLRLNRLLFAFGEARPLAAIVASSAEPREEGLVYFERGLVAIARIWGEAWKGRVLDAATLLQEAAPLLLLFSRRGSEVREWTYWHSLQSLRGEFYGLLIDAVADHDRAALDDLAEAFEAEWAPPESAGYWPADLRRSIVRSFFDKGKPVAWAVERLEALEAFMLEGEDTAGRISQCQKQAEAWRAIGKMENARRLIDRAIQVSFSVGYRKDYQLDDWIGWLDRANAVDRAGTKQRILWLARALPTLSDLIESRAVFSAANELLKACFRWSPRRALSLFEFFIRHRIIRYETALGGIVADAIAAGTLPSAMALHVLTEFLVPIVRSGNEALASAVIRKTHAEGRDAIEGGRMLLSQAERFGLPSTRKRWRRGVALALQSLGEDPGKLGLTDDDVRPDRDEGEIGDLRLKDGSRLTEDEASARVTSAADIEALLSNETEGLVLRLDADLGACRRVARPLSGRADRCRPRRQAAVGLRPRDAQSARRSRR